MLPQLYQTNLQKYLTPSQLVTLEMLIWLLQVHKQVQLERLAANLPIPILYQSRRRHLPRFLSLKQLSIALIWLPIIQEIVKQRIQTGSTVYVAIDRTQWRGNNVFMAAIIWRRRALPIYWNILNKKGSSNLNEQKSLLRPVFRLLKDYKIVILGDREFRSVELADWLCARKVAFVCRLKQDAYIQLPSQDYQSLKSLELKPGMKWYLPTIKLTKAREFSQGAVVGYWRRKYRGKQEKEAWYLLTNLSSVSATLSAYKKRSGIEAMFRDCKSGGYNLEDSYASSQRITNLVLLIALAYTISCLQGTKLKQTKQQQYINRLHESNKNSKRHSDFWVGLYGQTWLITWQFCSNLALKLMQFNPNKLPFFNRGLKAMSLIQSTF